MIPDIAIQKLEENYLEYVSSLKDVVDLGAAAVRPLMEAFDHKQPHPVIKALGLLLLTTPEAEVAIPLLVRNLYASHKVFADSFEAVVRAGSRVLPTIMKELDKADHDNDDEAIRHLLAAAVQMPASELPNIASRCLLLLNHPNEHIRDAASDTFANLGLPYGQIAIEKLIEMTQSDPILSVRTSARTALERLGNT